MTKKKDIKGKLVPLTDETKPKGLKSTPTIKSANKTKTKKSKPKPKPNKPKPKKPKKPKTKKSKSRKSKKAEVKIPKRNKDGSLRKVSRYLLLRSATADYCREQYGKACPQKEMSRIYWELKARYDDVPIGEVLLAMDRLLGHKDDNSIPDELVAFPWFSLESLMYQGDGLFFRKDDRIVIDFSSLGLGTMDTSHENLPWEFRDNYYSTLRGRSHEAIDNPLFAGGSDVIPYLIYSSSRSDVGSRMFVWELTQGFAAQEVVNAHTWVDSPIEHIRPSKTATIEQNPISADALRMAELDVKTNELRVRANEQREDALKRIDRMIDMGVISNEQYKAYYDDIMKKYARGGVL